MNEFISTLAKLHRDYQDEKLRTIVRTEAVDRAFATGGLPAAMSAAMRISGGWFPPDLVLWHLRRASEPNFTNPRP